MSFLWWPLTLIMSLTLQRRKLAIDKQAFRRTYKFGLCRSHRNESPLETENPVIDDLSKIQTRINITRNTQKSISPKAGVFNPVPWWLLSVSPDCNTPNSNNQGHYPASADLAGYEMWKNLTNIWLPVQKVQNIWSIKVIHPRSATVYSF